MVQTITESEYEKFIEENKKELMKIK